jgi:hypothetical protein
MKWLSLYRYNYSLGTDNYGNNPKFQIIQAPFLQCLGRCNTAYFLKMDQQTFLY